MIIRVLKGRVEARHVTRFQERARRVMAAACPDKGCASVRLGRQINLDGSEEIVMVSVWGSMDALYQWLGNHDLLGSAIRDGEDPLLECVDIQHYESFDVPAVPDESLSD